MKSFKNSKKLLKNLYMEPEKRKLYRTYIRKVLEKYIIPQVWRKYNNNILLLNNKKS